MVNKILNHFKNHGLFSTIAWLYNCILFKFRMRNVKSVDFEEIEIDKSEKKFLTPKSKPNIFIVASIPYYDIGGGQRCSQLAKTFNIMGYNVIYLYAFKSSESVRFDLSMPMAKHIFIDENTCKKIKSDVTKNDLFIFESPSPKFKDILDLAIERECKICYENIDNWETSLGSTVYNEDMLKRLLLHSDVLVGTAKPLVKQLEDYLVKYNIPSKPVLYLANAVDDELFCGNKELVKPDDLKTDKVTLLYYGSLWGEWFDWDLLINLAKKHPHYCFNIIGDYSNIKSITDAAPNNIHFLGLKKQCDLPAYLKYVDYSLIPFKPGEISDYVSPLKIFEYISMYTKVLCTELPDVKGYPNVYCGNTVEAWESIIESNPKLDKTAADEFILNNTWRARITEILNIVHPENNTSILKDKLSVIILNYNNKNVIFKCVNTLLKYNEIYKYKIIVVDNGSVDGSYEELQNRYQNNEIILLQNEKNGCSSGRNLGVANSDSEYIMFLDSDQWVTNKYWLQPYENIIQTHSDFGLIGWAAGFYNNKNRAYHVVDSFPYRYMPCNMLCRYDIGYLGSGGMITKRETFDNIEGFDVFYDPTCYEDTDFSMKVRNLGKEIYYCPYLGVIHLPHQTTKSGSKEHQELTAKKQEYFTRKWLKTNPSLFKYKK
ncbi:MAG: glycosyltransferase [Clostridia bacterium]|nr:glycosyltransferase [Clostridia bacterium]